MKKILLVLLTFSAITTGFSQKVQLDNLQATIDSLAHELVQDHQPGLSVGIIYRGQSVLNSHYGLMNLDYNMKNSGNTAYNLASVSKHITALGILLLEAEGKLKLQDKLGSYLSDLPEEYKTVTLDQLLHHTSGVPSTDNLRLFANISLDTPWTQEEELELLKKYAHLNFEPGTDHLYSNGGYSLLAEVIEVVSGQDFSEFFEERVFNPLGLQATAYNSLGKTIANRARGYKPVGEHFTDALTEAESVPGGSNFYFSMDDLLNWMNLFLQQDLLFSKQVSRMMKPSFVLSNGDTISYSYGLQVQDFKGIKAVHHSGGTPGFASYMILFPEHELGISLLTNNEKINAVKTVHQLAEKILAEFLVEESPVERVAISLPAEKLEKWTGSYRMKDGMILKVLLENEKLFLDLPQTQRFQLHPESNITFFIKEFDAQLSFSETSADKPSHFDLIQGDNIQTGLFVEPRELSRPSPRPDELVGSYQQPQLKITYSLIQKDGQLLLQLPDTFKKYLGFNSISLHPISGDVFTSDRLGVVEIPAE